MKITYFGTAAAEAIPAPGCDCEVCRYSRKIGGKNLRLRTQALIDDRLLIDFPPDALYYSMRYDVDYRKITGCIVSHSHRDHLYAPELESFDRGYSATDREEPLHFFAGEDGFRRIKETEDECSAGRRDATLIEPYRPFTFDGYEIHPLPAAHDKTSSPLLFHIAKDGKRMIWAHDTGDLPVEVLDALGALGRVDFLSIDCCGTFLPDCRDHHLCINTCEEVFTKLRLRGVIDGKTTLVINHFSHNGGATHDALEDFCREKPYVPSYDGMTVEF